MSKVWLIIKGIYNRLEVSLKICAILFTFIPEDCFKFSIFNVELSSGIEVIVNRIILLIVVFISYQIYIKNRKYVIGKYHNSTIEIRYGNIFSFTQSKIVIPFTECYTTKIGDGPNEIKKKSICGQFLGREDTDIDSVRNIISSKTDSMPRLTSEYNNLPRYKLGTLIPYQRFLFMCAQHGRTLKGESP